MMFIAIWIAASLFTGPVGFILWPMIYVMGQFHKPTPKTTDPHPFGDIPYEELP